MINILPNEGRTIARRSYVFKVVATATFAAAFVALATGALLFPSYIETTADAEAARAEAVRLAEVEKSVNGATDEPLALAQAQLKAFGPLVATDPPSFAIQSFLGVRGKGISVSQIEYDIAAARMILSGTASTRESLLLFVQALRKVAGVTTVDLPVNDLAKSENSRFGITVSFGEETSAPAPVPVVNAPEE